MAWYTRNSKSKKGFVLVLLANFNYLFLEKQTIKSMSITQVQLKLQMSRNKIHTHMCFIVIS